MIQEDKQLLLKDLCARLPYGVKVLYEGQVKEIQYIEPLYNELKLLEDFSNYTIGIKEVKPYLRPMSSMTEEECKTLGNIPATLENNLIEILPNIPYYIEVAVPNQIDWLNAHHFDYRGLIEKDLALEAPNDMYKI